MVWSILSSFGIFVICTYIYTYIYIRATTSRQPSFGPRISRTEMSDSDTTGNIRGQSLEKKGERTSPTEYGIRKRVSTRIRLCHGSFRGPRGVVLSLSNQITFPSLRKIFLLLRGQRRRKGGRRRVIRAISGTTEEISAVADHRPLPPWKVFVGRCSSGQSSYTFDNVR